MSYCHGNEKKIISFKIRFHLEGRQSYKLVELFPTGSIIKHMITLTNAYSEARYTKQDLCIQIIMAAYIHTYRHTVLTDNTTVRMAYIHTYIHTIDWT